MTKMNKPNCPNSKSDSRIDDQRHYLKKYMESLAKAIGSNAAATEIAILSSVVLQGYTKADQLRQNPKVRFSKFAERAADKLKGTGAPNIMTLRRKIWKCVMNILTEIGPFATIDELATQIGMMLKLCRYEDRVNQTPKAYYIVLAKRVDGTSLM